MHGLVASGEPCAASVLEGRRPSFAFPPPPSQPLPHRVSSLFPAQKIYLLHTIGLLGLPSFLMVTAARRFLLETFRSSFKLQGWCAYPFSNIVPCQQSTSCPRSAAGSLVRMHTPFLQSISRTSIFALLSMISISYIEFVLVALCSKYTSIRFHISSFRLAADFVPSAIALMYKLFNGSVYSTRARCTGVVLEFKREGCMFQGVYPIRNINQGDREYPVPVPVSESHMSWLPGC